ncbi:MAG TPA: hypothetical protein QGH16_02615, partial [Verrucomicrobiota bacterium]|nr:hypothetical protein [Verrucomicrobiota bacterium]
MIPKPGSGFVERDGLGKIDRYLFFTGAIQLRKEKGGVGIAGIDRLAKPTDQILYTNRLSQA